MAHFQVNGNWIPLCQRGVLIRIRLKQPFLVKTLTEFTEPAHVVRVAANELGVDFPVRFTARQPLQLRGMPEVRPPEHFVEQHGEGVRLLTHFGVHFAGQEQAGAPDAPLGLHRLQKHLQLFLFDLFQYRVGQRLQFGLRPRVGLGHLCRFAHAAAPGAMRPPIRLPVALHGRTAPPESPDEPRSFGPKHAGRKEGFPAKKRAWCPQIMKIPGSESRQWQAAWEKTVEKLGAGEAEEIYSMRQSL